MAVKYEYTLSPHEVLIIRPKTAVQIYYISLFLFTATCCGCADQPSPGRCRIRRKIVKRVKLIINFLCVLLYLLTIKAWLRKTVLGDIVPCVFVNTFLFIQPNKTYRSSILVLYYSQHVVDNKRPMY